MPCGFDAGALRQIVRIGLPLGLNSALYSIGHVFLQVLYNLQGSVFVAGCSVDELRLTLRADFPHDSYWTQATVAFDDGSREVLQLTKTAAPQVFALAPRTVQSLKLFELKKADDASPFPALTQIEVWGTEG